MLISQIIPIMFIAANVKGAQHGLKGPCVLVPAVWKRVRQFCPDLAIMNT